MKGEVSLHLNPAPCPEKFRLKPFGILLQDYPYRSLQEEKKQLENWNSTLKENFPYINLYDMDTKEAYKITHSQQEYTAVARGSSQRPVQLAFCTVSQEQRGKPK